MQNKKLIILLVLIIAAIFSLSYGIFAPSKARRRITVEQPKIPNSSAAIAAVKRDYKHTAYKTWGRDPFSIRPAVSSGPVLSGILWDKDNPRAIINNRIVSIGDKIGGNTVVKILQDGVILNNGTQDIELKLKS